ncbi:MAG: hypothetical protein HUU20_23635 [Pirellulales bacterium]|nr:hypothetical protein [Pirellulales bacterium]
MHLATLSQLTTPAFSVGPFTLLGLAVPVLLAGEVLTRRIGWLRRSNVPPAASAARAGATRTGRSGSERAVGRRSFMKWRRYEGSFSARSTVCQRPRGAPQDSPVRFAAHSLLPFGFNHPRRWRRRGADPPGVRMIQPGGRPWFRFQPVRRSGSVVGILVADALLAALAVEHDCVLRFTDAVCRRFRGLRWCSPIADRPPRGARRGACRPPPHGCAVMASE